MGIPPIPHRGGRCGGSILLADPPAEVGPFCMPITRDPVGYTAGMALYEYACARPTFALDSMGTDVGAPGIGTETGPDGTTTTTDIDFNYGPLKGTGTVGPAGGHVSISIPLLSSLKEVDVVFGSAKVTGSLSADISLQPLIPLNKCRSTLSPLKLSNRVRPIFTGPIPVGFMYTAQAAYGNALKVQTRVGYIEVLIAKLLVVSQKAEGSFLLPGSELKKLPWLPPESALIPNCCYNVEVHGEVEVQIYSYTALQVTAVAAVALAPAAAAALAAGLAPFAPAAREAIPALAM